MSHLICMIAGHNFHQIQPARIPPRWTHSLFCIRCAFTMNFVDPEPTRVEVVLPKKAEVTP
jgi:hypothetical protein